jgi:hypothetical protein
MEVTNFNFDSIHHKMRHPADTGYVLKRFDKATPQSVTSELVRKDIGLEILGCTTRSMSIGIGVRSRNIKVRWEATLL